MAEAIAGNVAPLNEPDLIREVALMSDKTDIREEIVQLRSHFGQFEQLLDSSEGQDQETGFPRSRDVSRVKHDRFQSQRCVYCSTCRRFR